jgi:hypothetical protein
MTAVRRVAAALALVIVPVAAQAESMVCAFNPDGHDRYVAREVRLSWDAFGSAVVKDAVIAGTGRASVPGQIEPSAAGKLVAQWEVRGVKPDPLENRRRDAQLIVRVTVTTGSGAAVMTVRDGSTQKYSYRANGACKLSG